MTPDEIERVQQTICVTHGVAYSPVKPDTICGLAFSTLGRQPVNGLRHPATDGMNGWFLWCGDEFSNSTDFFSPVHLQHVWDEMPEIIQFLALPAGYRFLVAGEYVDIWFDEGLLHV